MSRELINRSDDLTSLQNEGYNIEVRDGFLIIRSVPYVNATREITYGTLLTNLDIHDNRTRKPGDHQVWFSGEVPCDRDGSTISALGPAPGIETPCPGVDVDYRFSSKPKDGYENYYQKVTTYIRIISHPAMALDASVTAQTYPVVRAPERKSVFRYDDTASSRAGITNVSRKLAMNKIAIVGLGGTGAYVLDLVAKTPVDEIHLFDGDYFDQHNAFRSPGAASNEELSARRTKVARYCEVYGEMRDGIVGHELYVDEENVHLLTDFDYVFLCVDRTAVREIVFDCLSAAGVPFIDTGMDLSIVQGEQSLIGICRVTEFAVGRYDHYHRRVPQEGPDENGLYDSNIQVADLNCLNAAFAVIRWKKHCGFYQDCFKEHHSTYTVNAHDLTREEPDDEEVE